MNFRNVLWIGFILICLTTLAILFGGLRYYLTFVSLIFLFSGSLFLLRGLIIQAWQYASMGILMLFLGFLSLNILDHSFSLNFNIPHFSYSFPLVNVDWSRPLIGHLSCKDLGVCSTLLVLTTGIIRKKIDEAIILIAFIWITLFIYLKVVSGF